MTTRIVSATTALNMSQQLVDLGGKREISETGIVVKAPNGKEAFRAMHGTSGGMLARWPEGLFDETETAQNRDG